MNEAPSHWPTLITALASFLVAGATALGIWYARKKQPAEVNLLTAQTGVNEATREKLDAERESFAVASLSRVLADAVATIDRLRDERDEYARHAGEAEQRADRLKAEVDILRNELDTMRGVLKANGLDYPR